MLSRVSLPLAAAAMLGGCAGAPDATWRVPPTYADAGAAAAESEPQPQNTPAVALPPEAGRPTGPVGTAGAATSPTGYDRVGYANWHGDDEFGRTTTSDVSSMSGAASAAHHSLPLGSFAEVTSLETGRTILVQINDRTSDASDHEIDLSGAAARALGIDAHAIGGVRVRAVTPSPADAAALRQGQMAAPRLDTPEPVLRALRRELPVTTATSTRRGVTKATAGIAPPPRNTPAARSTVKPQPGAGYAAPGAVVDARPGYTPSAPLRSERVAAAALPRKPVRTQPAAAAETRTRPAQSGFVVQVAALSSEDRARKLARDLRGTVEQGGGVWRVRLGPFRDLAGAQAARDDAVRRGYGDAAILMAP